MADLLSLLPSAKSSAYKNKQYHNKKKLSNPADLQLVVNNNNETDANTNNSNANYISSQIAKQGRRKNETVHSSFQALVPRSVSKDLIKPSKEEEAATARTYKSST